LRALSRAIAAGLPVPLDGCRNHPQGKTHGRRFGAGSIGVLAL
jgi:hypothetical protein